MEHGSHRDDGVREPDWSATNLEERVNHEDFTEHDDVQWMKHVLTIGSQTRGGSTGCVGVPRGD